MKLSGHASPTTVIGVVMTFTFIAAVAVALRLWTRFAISHQPGIDDLVVTLSLIFTSMVIRYGLGKHQDSLSDHDSMYLLLWFFISIWNYYLGLGLAKLSIVLQCLRIFGNNKRFRISAYILGAVIAVFTAYTVFITIFLCQPTSHFWHPERPGKCLNRLPIWFFNSSFSIATDIATAVLPLPVVNSLNLPKKQRRMLMAVFGLGGAVCAVSLIRFYALYAIAISKDPSWDNPLAALYANLEATVGIIASCLPTMKGIVSRFFPTLFSTSGASREVTPAIELSATKSNLSSGIRRVQSTVDRVWDPTRDNAKRGLFSRVRSGFVKVKITETTQDGGEERTQASGSVGSPLELKNNEIKVTTTVEQVERRKEDWVHDSKENLVPAMPFERP
ncbi:hypothetical protein M409DRAFT_69573 [Zasmidium cellare ATCC 36951]|uniref:Rhodopsin domain-containing protein n=1 Tax=Zasmidium cellare ATCC 36951 TaxID=1080233 RepID=A0A6A6C798_ZASCE|nr:uncharacterized protein M409DRAFT_69573 [Zasmidium cellare ATCC 36951]KAF2161772.1 hypothetical protein M409DRAFT_69573 [Zasmidium cellare ATCC 36951]